MKDFNDFNDENLENAAKRIEKDYGNKSQKDIFGAIMAQAEKSKREGTLSNDEIDKFYAALAPSLSSSQKKRLKKIVEELKNI